uniref:DUF4293 domain-containing protein n=1 Tax=Flavobacterium sp. TaxID=239 RepID=UPI0040499508
MLQRIQTVYLLLVLVFSCVLPNFLQLGVQKDGNALFFTDNFLYMGLFVASGLLALLSIFSFKKRQNQFVLGRLNMILNLILLGLLVFNSLKLSGESQVSVKGIGIILPILSIVFLVLANKAIKKDEDLVKSVDRLR